MRRRPLESEHASSWSRIPNKVISNAQIIWNARYYPVLKPIWCKQLALNADTLLHGVIENGLEVQACLRDAIIDVAQNISFLNVSSPEYQNSHEFAEGRFVLLWRDCCAFLEDLLGSRLFAIVCQLTANPGILIENLKTKQVQVTCRD